MVLTSDLLREQAHILGKKLDGAAAIGTNHVVMTAAVVLMLEASNAVVESDLARQSTFRQQLECSVDGCIADTRIFLLYQAMQFVGRKMIPGFEEGVQDHVALRGLLQPDLFEMAVKDVLRFANHLAGDGGLIINALLEHAELGSGYQSDLENEIHFQHQTSPPDRIQSKFA